MYINQETQAAALSTGRQGLPFTDTRQPQICAQRAAVPRALSGDCVIGRPACESWCGRCISVPFDEERDWPLMDKVAMYLDAIGRSVTAE